MKQPEALWLAEILSFGSDQFNDEAAAELRRLHQSEHEGWRYAEELEQERKRLNETNQAMLEALRELLDMDVAYQRGPKVQDAVEKARAAIAKGEQS